MSFLILQADARQIPLGDKSVQCCVTSPPYWRQRDYRVDGQIGLEERPENYIEQLMIVFREIKRCLRDDGTLWLNIGDKWASGGNGGGGSFMESRGEAWAHAKNAKGWRSPPAGYKDKDLVGLPWMLAFALRSDGWYLRSEIIWAKPNCMPGSQEDRPTASHETLFLLTKRADYWSDFSAIKTPPRESSLMRLAQDIQSQAGSHRANGSTKTNGPMKAVQRGTDKQRGHSRQHAGFNDRWDQMEKNQQQSEPAMIRDVWFIAPATFNEAHFAVMPNELARRCILAGCPVDGIVLDPFSGAGTTALVADKLGRKGIGLELKWDYVVMSKKRLTNDAPLLAFANALRVPVAQEHLSSTPLFHDTKDRE